MTRLAIREKMRRREGTFGGSMLFVANNLRACISKVVRLKQIFLEGVVTRKERSNKRTESDIRHFLRRRPS